MLSDLEEDRGPSQHALVLKVPDPISGLRTLSMAVSVSAGIVITKVLDVGRVWHITR